jgi:hypothetical protein
LRLKVVVEFDSFESLLVCLRGAPLAEDRMEGPEQAIQQGVKTIDRWAQAAQATGRPIPLPKTLEAPWRSNPLDHLKKVGLIAIGTQEDYLLALSARNDLRERVGDNQTHPLAAVLEVLAGKIAAYEQDQHPI